MEVEFDKESMMLKKVSLVTITLLLSIVFVSIKVQAKINNSSFLIRSANSQHELESTNKGFIMHLSDGNFLASEKLQSNNIIRVNNLSQSFIKGAEEKSLLRLSACFSFNMSSPDFCVVYFDPNATKSEFDGQLDALKLMNTDLNVPNVYVVTPGGTNISIKALPYNTNNAYTVPLGFKIRKPGEIIFRINDMAGSFVGMRVSLLDNVTGKIQDLLNNQEYKVTLGIGEYLNRFFLNFSNITTRVSDSFAGLDFFSIYYSKGVLKTYLNGLQGGEGSLVLMNFSGQALLKNKLYGEGYHEYSIYLQDGIYIAAMISGTKSSIKKILIRNE